MGGVYYLCVKVEVIIIGRNGGFVDYVCGYWLWVIFLLDEIDMVKVGLLLCGGIIVFYFIMMVDVKFMDWVGVIGIGGLGYLVIKFLKYWGCEVIVFSFNLVKMEEVLKMGVY